MELGRGSLRPILSKKGPAIMVGALFRGQVPPALNSDDPGTISEYGDFMA